jgi:hypothetical protein
MRTIIACMISALLGDAAFGQSSGAAQQAAQNAAVASRRQQEEDQRRDAATRTRALIGLDPSRIHTVGVWPGPTVPCKLPKRDAPYECHRLVEGPALLLTPVPGELIVATGDQALADGKRSWWLRFNGLGHVDIMAIASGEVLYAVGDPRSAWGDGDLVVTLYR